MAIATASLASANATLVTQTDTVAAATLGQAGIGAMSVNVSGTFSATLVFEASADNTNWVAVAAHPVNANSGLLTSPVLSTTAAGLFVVPVYGYAFLRVRVSSYTSGAAVVSTDVATSAPAGALASNLDGQKPTYSTFLSQIAGVAGDTFLLAGAANRIVRVTRVEVGPSLATAAGTQVVQALLRSTAPTGGTAGTAPAVAKHDKNDANSIATPSYYTAAPTAGTLLGVLRSTQLGSTATNATGTGFIWSFGNGVGRLPVLRAATDYFVINFSAALAGQKVDLSVEWMEE